MRVDPAHKGAVFMRLDLVAQSHPKGLKWSARPELRYLAAVEDDEIRSKVKDRISIFSAWPGDEISVEYLYYKERPVLIDIESPQTTCEETAVLIQAVAARSKEVDQRIEETKATIRDRHLTSLSRVKRSKERLLRQGDERRAIVDEAEALHGCEGKSEKRRLHQLEREYRYLQNATKSHIDRVSGQARCFEGISRMSSQSGAIEVASAYKDLSREMSEEESQPSDNSKTLRGYEI